MTEPKSDATRMGLVATLAVLSFCCLIGSSLMWIGSILPEEAVWWTLVTAGAAFASAFILGVVLAFIGARKRSETLLVGDGLDMRGAELNIKRLPGEADPAYRRRMQRSVVSKGVFDE